MGSGDAHNLARARALGAMVRAVRETRFEVRPMSAWVRVRLYVAGCAAALLAIMATTPASVYTFHEPPLVPRCLYQAGDRFSYRTDWYRGVVKVSPPSDWYTYKCPVLPA